MAAAAVRTARGPDEVALALALRERVFCGEQGVELDAERDGLDSEAVHVVAVAGEQVVGTCRLLIEGAEARVGRMAVEPRRRGGGIGSAVLAAAEQHAARAGATVVRLHAQAAAEPLYVRAGYSAYGERFVEEGIHHVAMEKLLEEPRA